MKFYNTTTPYKVIEYDGIQYNVCKDYSHLSRYRSLRQVVHNPTNVTERFIALETPNEIHTSTNMSYHTVVPEEVNRLDLIAYKLLGSANYKWILSYINGIEDGYTAYEGQVLMYPTAGITALFSKGEILAPLNPFSLNLGSE